MSYYLAGIVLFFGSLVFAADLGASAQKSAPLAVFYRAALTLFLALCALVLFLLGTMS